MAQKCFVCNHCKKEFKRKNNGHQYKYCSRGCFYDARFGSVIPGELINMRNPLCLEAVKLYQSGATMAEASREAGIPQHILTQWIQKHGNQDLRSGQVCRHCGNSIANMQGNRRYCSKTCYNKARYAREHPGPRQKIFDMERRAKGMELYWGGLGGAAIAQYLMVSEGTVRSWIHHLGHLRKREYLPEVLALIPVEHRLSWAETKTDWKRILRENSPIGDQTPIYLVSELVDGKSGGGLLSSIIMESLHRNPCDGETYAFCTTDERFIITVRWNGDGFFCTKCDKAKGRYIWPDENIGLVRVRKNEFEHLLTLSKKRKIKPEISLHSLDLSMVL